MGDERRGKGRANDDKTLLIGCGWTRRRRKTSALVDFPVFIFSLRLSLLWWSFFQFKRTKDPKMSPWTQFYLLKSLQEWIRFSCLRILVLSYCLHCRESIFRVDSQKSESILKILHARRRVLASCGGGAAPDRNLQVIANCFLSTLPLTFIPLGELS